MSDDRPFPFPFKGSRLVPPHCIEMRDADGIVVRRDLRDFMSREEREAVEFLDRLTPPQKAVYVPEEWDE